MALGKGSKMDPRRSSSNYSAATIIVFVSLCLIGAWMMTSSTVVPGDMSSSESNYEVKQQISETNERSYEDSSGDVPEEEIKTEDIDTSTKDSLAEAKTEDDKNVSTKMNDSSVELTQEGHPDQSTEDKTNESDNTSRIGTYSDENGKTEGGVIIKEATEKDGVQEKGQDKSTEQSSQEKMEKQKSDEIVSEEQVTKSEQSLSENTDDEQNFSDENKVSEEEKNDGDSSQDGNDQSQTEEKDEGNKDKSAEENSEQKKEHTSNEAFPDGEQSELLNETSTQNGAWVTQDTESKNEKEVRDASLSNEENSGYNWKLCNVIAGPDYIPCLDNEEAIRNLRSTKHYEHRERHCPVQAPTCLVPLPEGYKIPIHWPNSRNKIWYYNVPHAKLAIVKGHQNWVKVTGEYLTFPGGGTQFKHGALHYIDFIQESLSDISWGKRSRVVLDVGCGVASFGGFLFDRDVLTMSFAPKDEHEAQVQFALERGIPALSAVMGTQRLPFPSMVFDVIHCARCRVPWHIEGGMLLLELNRLLRPGGYFIWSATPVYQKLPEDVEIWKAMSALTKQMCWQMINKTKDSVNQVGLAIFRKPSNNKCYEKRRSENNPPLCQESDDPNAAWNIPLQACMHKLPVDPSTRGSKLPGKWPKRLESTPYWLNSSQVGVYGKPAPEDFQADYEHWKHVISNSYLNGMGIDWSTVRNVMDMRAVYGGFAAALKDMKVWVMNIVTIDSSDTLPVIYERGLFGMYHDWCESLSTYPRTYDLLHADHLFSNIITRCKLLSVFTEVDRILRPEGKLIIRDSIEIINEIESMAKSLRWEIRMTYSKNKEGLLCVKKTMWRPTEVEATTSPLS